MDYRTMSFISPPYWESVLLDHNEATSKVILIVSISFSWLAVINDMLLESNQFENDFGAFKQTEQARRKL